MTWCPFSDSSLSLFPPWYLHRIRIKENVLCVSKYLDKSSSCESHHTHSSTPLILLIPFHSYYLVLRSNNKSGVFSERRLSQYIIGTNMVTHVPCSVSVGTPIMKRAWDKVYLALNPYLKFYTSHRWLCRRLRKRWVHVLHSLRKNVAFNWYWVFNVSYLGCRRK